MCRFVAHLGERVLLDDILFEPDSSIIDQAVYPQMLSALNLAGFGLLAWDGESPGAELPYSYRTAAVPFYDRNLRALSRKVRVTALIAHVRGVIFSDREVVNEQNVHPFRYEGVPVALAMNGDLDRFPEMRADVAELVAPEVSRRVEGTTDSEWLYALILSQLRDPTAPADPEELAAAVERSLRIVREVRDRRGLQRQSAVNLVLSDGRCMVATRFAYDYGWYHEGWTFAGGERRYDYTTLWYAAGAGGPDESLVVASEPLTRDREGWLESPEYSLLIAESGPGGVAVETRELDA
jgi:glutamine amidotransferase